MIRSGFVSNSSSSSFVIGKYFMTPEQIEEFHNIVKRFYESGDPNVDDGVLPLKFMEYVIDFDDDTYIYEDDKYFFGMIGQTHYDTMIQFMEKHNLGTKYSVEE